MNWMAPPSGSHLEKNINQIRLSFCFANGNRIRLSFCFANDNWMTCLFDLHFFPNMKWIEVSSGCHFQNKMRIG